MGARNVIESTVGQVLESSSNSGCRVVLHGGHVDNLRHFAGHNPCHVGSGLPLAEEIGVAINIRLVAHDAAGEGVLDTHDANSSRQQRLIATDIHLIRIPVVDYDISRRHSNRPDCVNDLS